MRRACVDLARMLHCEWCLAICLKETAVNRFAMAAVLCAFAALGMSLHAEEPSAVDDIRTGRALSLRLCTVCHVVSSDQEMAPILRPPASNFHSIANKPGTTADSLRRFLS
jgi:hypothetical protein